MIDYFTEIDTLYDSQENYLTVEQDYYITAAFFAGLEVGQRRPDNGFEVDAGVRIELVVLNGQKRLGHKGGHLIQGNQVTPFAVQFPDQTAVAGQDRGHQRWTQW